MQYWNVLLYQKLRGCCSRFTNEVHCLLFLELARKGKQYHSHSRQLLVAKVPRFSCLAFQVAKAKWVSFFSLLRETFSSLSKYVDFNNFLLAFISIVYGDDQADFALRSVEHSKRSPQLRKVSLRNPIVRNYVSTVQSSSSCLDCHFILISTMWLTYVKSVSSSPSSVTRSQSSKTARFLPKTATIGG